MKFKLSIFLIALSIGNANAGERLKGDHKNKKGCHYTEVNKDGTHTLVHGKKGKILVEIKSIEKGNKL
ncbi:MAG: hypothetical protein ABW157_06455 [Candidatus Thiodiazotropha sp. LLP2]